MNGETTKNSHSLHDTMPCMKIRLNDIAEEQGSSS